MNIMVDSWYAEKLEYNGFSFHSWLEKRRCYRILRPVISRIGFVRGLFLFICARQSSGAVVVCDSPGFWTFLILRAIAGTPGRCFVLEFIRRCPIQIIKRLIYPIWFAFIAAPAVRRSVTIAQVMTLWERKHYAKKFGIEEDRFIHIPFPMISSESANVYVKKRSGNYVMSSGRNSCDWVTLISAVADLPQYQVKIVHSKKDLKKIKQIKPRADYSHTILKESP